MLSICGTKTNSQGAELIEHGSSLFPIACYDDNLKKISVPWHYHEEFEAGFVTAGSIFFNIASDHFELSAGDVFFVNSNILHDVRATSSPASSLRSFVFHPSFISGGRDTLLFQKYLSPIVNHPSLPALVLHSGSEDGEQAYSYLTTSWDACDQETPAFEFYVREQLSKLLLLIYQNYLVDHPKIPQKVLRDNARIKQMLEFLHRHYAQPITVQQIADSASLSVSECMRVFHNTISSPPIAYLKQYRLQQSAFFLKTTDIKISSICEQCGFQDVSYYSKAFRKYFGCTPSEYREKN